MFKSPVQSGFWPSKSGNRDRNRSSNFLDVSKTGLDRLGPVFTGPTSVGNQLATGLDQNQLRPVAQPVETGFFVGGAYFYKVISIKYIHLVFIYLKDKKRVYD